MRISDWSSDVCSSELATLDDHPSAMHQADAATLDEPVFDPHDGDGAGFGGRREGGDDADRKRAVGGEPGRSPGAVLQLRADPVLPLCVSDNALHHPVGAAICTVDLNTSIMDKTAEKTGTWKPDNPLGGVWKVDKSLHNQEEL